ncbi:MAG: tetratricopeptide repeat protein [bacterium]
MKSITRKKYQVGDFIKLHELIVTCLLGLAILLYTTNLWAGGGKNVNKAKNYIQKGNLDPALVVLMKEIEDVNPNNEDAWYLLGYVYTLQNKYVEMKEAFIKAMALEPKFKDKGIKIKKDPGKLLNSGELIFSQFGVEMITHAIWRNFYNHGVRFFNDAQGAETDSAKMTNFEQAAENFRMAALIIPDSTASYRYMAWALINIGKSEKCIEPLQQAVEHNPNNFEIKSLLATAYIATKQDSLALSILEDLWDKGYRTTEVMDYLSRAYTFASRTEEARAVYKEAIESNPNDFQFRFNYGTFLLEVNEYDAAIEQLRKAYEIDAESADLNYNLGVAYLNRGVSKRESLPEDSEDKSYMEDFKLALPYLEKSIKMNPFDESTWFILGQISANLNKNSLAGYAFSKSEPTKSALDNKVIVGMPSSSLKTILGEPNVIKPLESEVFSGVEEWIYKKRPKLKGQLAIPEQVNVYVENGRVDAIMVLK